MMPLRASVTPSPPRVRRSPRRAPAASRAGRCRRRAAILRAVEHRVGRAAPPASASRRWRSASRAAARASRRAAKIASAKLGPGRRRGAGEVEDARAGRGRRPRPRRRSRARRRCRAPRSGRRAGRRRRASRACRGRRASMVFTKFLPCAENTQAVRRITWSGVAGDHRALAGELAGAVGAERPGRVVLAPRPAGVRAVEARSRSRRAGTARPSPPPLRPSRRAPSALTACAVARSSSARVDGGVGGGVDDDVGVARRAPRGRRPRGRSRSASARPSGAERDAARGRRSGRARGRPGRSSPKTSARISRCACFRPSRSSLWPRAWIACHQSRLSRYQRTVRRSPSSRVTDGCPAELAADLARRRSRSGSRGRGGR